LYASLVTAQSPQHQVDAWLMTAHVKARTVDSTIPTPPGPLGTIEVVAVRALRAGEMNRIDFTPDPAAGSWGSGINQILPSGMSWLWLGNSGSVPVAFLDSTQKKFITPKLENVPHAFWSMHPMQRPGDTAAHQSPNDPVARIVDISVTVDSLGAGPVFLGHPTLHYRQTQHVTVQTAFGDMATMTIKLEGVEDVDIAIDIPHAPPIDGRGIQQVGQFTVELAMTPQITAALQAASGKYPHHGVILHMDGRETAGSLQGPVIRLMTMDVDHWESTRVEASLFTIPAGYTQQDMWNTD
jgi:hypothetical protein